MVDHSEDREFDWEIRISIDCGYSGISTCQEIDWENDRELDWDIVLEIGCLYLWDNCHSVQKVILPVTWQTGIRVALIASTE